MLSSASRSPLQRCLACLKRVQRGTRLHCRRYTDEAGPSNKYDILFCGSDSFSVASLAALLKAPDVWSSIRVVAPQPKATSQQKKGKQRANLSERPLDLYRPSLREFASDHDLPLDLIDWKTGIAGYQPSAPFDHPSPFNSRNLLITASFGYILPDTFLDRFYRTHKLNVHPSLLPRWRGAAPIQWTIAKGDTTTGVSVQRLGSKTKGIDAGKLVGVVDGIDVPVDSTYWDLLPHLGDEGGRLLVDTLRKMQAGTVQPIAQDPALVTRAPKIRHETARVRWGEQTASEISRLARGIAHQEPLWTRLAQPTSTASMPAPTSTSPNTEVQLLDLISPPPSSIPTLAREGFSSIPIGSGIVHKPTKALYIAAAPEADGDALTPAPTFVKVEQVRPAGRKAMGVWEWFNGLDKGLRAGKRVDFEV